MKINPEEVRKSISRMLDTQTFEYEIVTNAIGKPLVIRDTCKGRSITNSAREVVRELMELDLLPPGRRLFYHDTMGRTDEITRDSKGSFTGFKAIAEKDPGWLR